MKNFPLAIKTILIRNRIKFKKIYTKFKVPTPFFKKAYDECTTNSLLIRKCWNLAKMDAELYRPDN